MTFGRAPVFLLAAAFDLLHARLANHLVHQVPLIDHHDAGFARLDNSVGDLLVLLRDSAFGIQNEDRDVAAGDGILGALDAEKLNGVIHAAGLAQARGVNQHVALPRAVRLDFEGHIHGIAGGARNGADDDALGPGQCVDDGGFSDVGPSDDGELERGEGRRARDDRSGLVSCLGQGVCSGLGRWTLGFGLRRSIAVFISGSMPSP